MNNLVRKFITDGSGATAVEYVARVSGTDIDVETLKTLTMFCGMGLTVSLLLAAYGFDLGAEYF